MKLLDIVARVGTAILRDAVPGGGLLLAAVNEFLPGAKALPLTATGRDIAAAVEGLPAAKRAALIEREFDVEIEQIKQEHNTLRDALKYDAENPHSTRPYIAKGAFQIVAACSLAVIAVWCVAVVRGDWETVAAVQEGAQFILFVLGPLVTLLWAYFGVLKTEHKNKLDAASGNSAPGGLSGLLTAFIRRR